MASDTQWLGSMPEVYDSRLGPALFEPYAAHLADIAAALRPDAILELAAGTGIVTRALTEALPNAQVTATDLNEAMVGWGTEHVPRARWSVADAQQLPFDDKWFELVVCQFGVMFFPDRRGAYAEARRVLTDGGTFLIASWDSVDGTPVAAILQGVLEQMFVKDPPRFLPRTPYGYHDPQAISADLTAAGLRDMQVERVTAVGLAPSARSLVEGYCLGSPLRFELDARNAGEEVLDQGTAAVAAALGDGPIDVELAAYVATARR
jgi:ubiquinone/menaquinone biosynthesis C-methylase UbiE